MMFLRQIGDFLRVCLNDFDRRYLLPSQEYKQAKEAADRLRSEIEARSTPEVVKLLEQYDEATSEEQALAVDSALMCGFRLALELMALALAPQVLWVEAEEEREEKLAG